MCGDPSITYPYLHREAIPDELLIAGGIIITGLTVSAHHPDRCYHGNQYIIHFTQCEGEENVM